MKESHTLTDGLITAVIFLVVLIFFHSCINPAIEKMHRYAQQREAQQQLSEYLGRLKEQSNKRLEELRKK